MTLSQYLPAAHSKHMLDPDIELWFSGHCSHSDAPGPENLPIAHCLHENTESPPLKGSSVPDAHETQALLPFIFWYFPSSHNLHDI